ncbi:MAG: hypothetical protein LBD02_08520, partial [Christensenellaceae bacterium]|nr:hypothetical protein [Christensenellaceae bacterium]
MAVTSLWAVKGRIDHLINYVENPEKTRADTVGDKELQALWDIVGYTTRAEKTEQKLFVNGINGSANKRREMGLDDTGYCDAQMIAEWKMEAMGKLLLESLWTERKSAVQLACQMLRDCVCDEPVNQGS